LARYVDDVAVDEVVAAETDELAEVTDGAEGVLGVVADLQFDALHVDQFVHLGPRLCPRPATATAFSQDGGDLDEEDLQEELVEEQGSPDGRVHGSLASDPAGALRTGRAWCTVGGDTDLAKDASDQRDVQAAHPATRRADGESGPLPRLGVRPELDHLGQVAFPRVADGSRCV